MELLALILGLALAATGGTIYRTRIERRHTRTRPLLGVAETTETLEKRKSNET